MDELLKALVGLVNTGGALADDALYLYFGLQIIQYGVWPLSLAVIFRGIREWVSTYMKQEKSLTALRILEKNGEKGKEFLDYYQKTCYHAMGDNARPRSY